MRATNTESERLANAFNKGVESGSANREVIVGQCEVNMQAARTAGVQTGYNMGFDVGGNAGLQQGYQACKDGK
jgi:hypothetical protein